MDDATLRARLQDLREGLTGDAVRGANAFVSGGRWRDQHDAPWLDGREAIRAHLDQGNRTRREWDPFEVVVEGPVALVRFRLTVHRPTDAVVREGWTRLGLGEKQLHSWDALWTSAARD